MNLASPKHETCCTPSPVALPGHCNHFTVYTLAIVVKFLNQMMLGALYTLTLFSYIPSGVDVLYICNCTFVILLCLLKLVSLYRIRQSEVRARQLAAAAAEDGRFVGQ